MLRIMQKHPSAPVFLWAATLFKKREKKFAFSGLFLFLFRFLLNIKKRSKQQNLIFKISRLWYKISRFWNSLSTFLIAFYCRVISLMKMLSARRELLFPFKIIKVEKIRYVTILKCYVTENLLFHDFFSFEWEKFFWNENVCWNA